MLMKRAGETKKVWAPGGRKSQTEEEGTAGKRREEQRRRGAVYFHDFIALPSIQTPASPPPSGGGGGDCGAARDACRNDNGTPAQQLSDVEREGETVLAFYGEKHGPLVPRVGGKKKKWEDPTQEARVRNTRRGSDRPWRLSER